MAPRLAEQRLLDQVQGLPAQAFIISYAAPKHLREPAVVERAFGFIDFFKLAADPEPEASFNNVQYYRIRFKIAVKIARIRVSPINDFPDGLQEGGLVALFDECSEVRL
jgi:hypothetical protein